MSSCRPNLWVLLISWCLWINESLGNENLRAMELFENHCFDCHDEDVQKGNVNMAKLFDAGSFDGTLMFENLITAKMALPPRHWPEDRSHIDRVWQDGNGDCRQELVLIGRNMDKQALVAMLDECLLTEHELSSDETTWPLRFTDPFPEWQVGDNGMES